MQDIFRGEDPKSELLKTDNPNLFLCPFCCKCVNANAADGHVGSADHGKAKEVKRTIMSKRHPIGWGADDLWKALNGDPAGYPIFTMRASVNGLRDRTERFIADLQLEQHIRAVLGKDVQTLQETVTEVQRKAEEAAQQAHRDRLKLAWTHHHTNDKAGRDELRTAKEDMNGLCELVAEEHDKLAAQLAKDRLNRKH
eukprot:gene9307-9237_t